MARFPTTNLTQKYVCYAFGYLKARLSTLCTHPDINIWSKYKPVSRAFTGNRPSDWWKGRNNNCGISYTVFSRVTDFVSAVDAGRPLFMHDAPTGTQNAPYRLGDFCGYNPDAVPPIFASNVKGKYYQNYGEMGVSCVLRQPMEGELSAADVFDNSLQGNYFGCALVEGSGSSMTYRWMTADGRIADNDTVITVPIDVLKATKYRVYFFVTNLHKPDFTSGDAAGQIMGMPGEQAQEIEIISTNIWINIQAQFVDGGVTGRVIVNNMSGEYVFLNNCAVHFRYGNKDEGDAFVQGEGLVNLGNITVPPEDNVETPFQRLGVLQDYATMGGGKVWFYANNQLQAQASILMEAN